MPSTDCARYHGEAGGVPPLTFLLMGILRSLPSESLLPLKPAPWPPLPSAEGVGRTWYSGGGSSRETFLWGPDELQREQSL